MDVKFVEAGNAGQWGNWGKFLVGCYTDAELAVPARYPGCEQVGSLIRSQRWNLTHRWVCDLATGEGALFPIGTGSAVYLLERHQIHVCPLFGPFLGWLDDFAADHQGTWFADLPPTVELPDVSFALFGHRRPGPGGAGDPA